MSVKAFICKLLRGHYFTVCYKCDICGIGIRDTQEYKDEYEKIEREQIEKGNRP